MAEDRGQAPVGPDPGPAGGRPVLRIVRGEPSDAELVALVVALARRSADDATAAPVRSLWRSRSRNIRPAVSPSPGAWRASGLPR